LPICLARKRARAILQLNEDLARYIDIRGDMSGRDPGDLSRDFSGRALSDRDSGKDKSRRRNGPKLDL
jgi:hypothetical protein